MANNTKSWLLLFLALVPVFWLFGPALLTDGSFIYRDAGHYYRPLYEYVHAEWMAGRPPLWNPWENCGQPLAADPTAAAFYPGKVIYLLPLSPGPKFTAYVLAHFLLAGAGAFALARAWNASPYAALCAAVSYACSGSVLFQYCNVIFLVGAAWLPFVLVAEHHVLTTRCWKSLFGLAVSLALIVLGGDIQMAYHAVLLVLLYAFVFQRFIASRETQLARLSSFELRASSFLRHSSFVIRHSRPLIAAFACAATLSAVQLLPTLEYGPHTDRAYYDEPRSIYEGFSPAAWFHEPPEGTHHAAIYEFSVGPWRLIEFFWPNVSGKNFPIHRRWLDMFPAEDRTWTPSLYFGVVPLILALLSFRLRRADAPQRFASWLVVLGLLASFGRFGLGWLIQELAHDFAGVDPQQIGVGQPVGGLYWFFVTFLPGYAMFRYPAKWLVIAALGLSLLVARGWDEYITARRDLLVSRWLKGLLFVSLGLFVFVLLLGFLWPEWMSGVPVDDLFGPFDRVGAQRDLLVSLLHTALVCGVVLVLIRKLSRSSNPWLQPSLLALTAVELCLAQQWMLPVAADVDVATSDVTKIIWPGNREANFSRYFRALDEGFSPPLFSTTSSPNRLAEIVSWNKFTLFPKLHLGQHVSCIETPGLAMSVDHELLLEVARAHGETRPDGLREPDPQVLELLGASRCILPADFAYPGRPQTGFNLREPVEIFDYRPHIETKMAHLGRAFAVHEAHLFPELNTHARTELWQRTEQFLVANGGPRDLRRAAMIESPDVATPRVARVELDRLALSRREAVSTVNWQPGAMLLEANLAADGYVIVCEGYDPNWVAQIRKDGVDEIAPPLVRADRVFVGLPVPAGKHRIELNYRPRAVYWGGAISGLSWTGVIIAAVLSTLRAFRKAQGSRLKPHPSSKSESSLPA